MKKILLTYIGFTAITCIAQFPNPIKNLTGECLNGTLSLTWERPDITLQYNNEWWGFMETSAPLIIACRWDASDLENLGIESGMTISSIGFVHPDHDKENITLKVWQGGSWPEGPEKEIYNQIVEPFSLIGYEWNDIILDPPVVIDATQMLWIGYKGVFGGQHGIDSGPIVKNTYSNCIYINYWNSYGWNYNWCLRANINNTNGKETKIGYSSKSKTENNNIIYVVYQDEEKIGETEIKTFTINGIEGLHNYCVVAVYNDSTMSKSVCIDVPCEVNINESNNIENLIVYPNSTNGKIVINSFEFQINEIEIFDLYGRKQRIEVKNKKEIDISDLSVGIYFIRIQTEKGVITKKIIKQ